MVNFLDRICDCNHLTQEETGQLFRSLVRGELDPVQISAYLVAFRTKGETPDEIAGAAKALKEAAMEFPRPEYPCADSCGTGGDGANTINVSTAVALVAAEMGVPITKHGNRSVSSKCGSADLLEQLGVKIDASPEVARRCLDEAGICFLFAPQYHGGLRHAMPVRKALGIRTVFNMLGPLVNPASPEYQVMGVYRPDLCVPVARVIGLLGCTSALVVHGSGLDEIAIHGLTTAALLKDGEVTEMEINPSEEGFSTFPIDAIRGGEAQENAQAFTRLLKGDGAEAHNSIVAINAGALAWVFGKSKSLKEGAKMALNTIESGKTIDRVKLLAELSNGA